MSPFCSFKYKYSVVFALSSLDFFGDYAAIFIKWGEMVTLYDVQSKKKETCFVLLNWPVS